MPPSTTSSPEWIEERNWFFQLSAYQDRLLALYDEQDRLRAAGVPRERGQVVHRGRAQGLLDQPRGPVVGIPIRGTPARSPTWADALVNYLSA